MEGETASISLLEHLSEPGFRSSVIATYNCYFPFYEDVVLRRMVAAGCMHNVLLVDAARCAEAFASDALRPRRAGRDYTLIPVRAGGAFHPKILLRVGRSKGALFVGSHNLTLSGFGMNDEVTSVFRAEGASARGAAGPIRRAFDYLAGYIPSGLPDVVDAYEGVKLGVPWLEGPIGAVDQHRALLTSSSAQADLWSQVAPLVPHQVSMAFICAPFFDNKLIFLRRHLADVQPREMVIGIDPASVEIDPAEALALAGVRFVNVAGVPRFLGRQEGARPYLHAKLLWFAGADGELLITGSANPSVAAFLAPPAARNAEAVVADRRAGSGSTLGIEALLAAPTITPSDWQSISQRRALFPQPAEATGRRVWIATPTPRGFQAAALLPVGAVLRGHGDDGTILGDAVVQGEPNGLSIQAPEPVRAEARFLRGDESVLVLVHRTEEIARNLGGDTRKALRHAIGSLEEDARQLEDLLKLAEKVIFDADDVVRTTPIRTAAAPDAADEPVPGAASLALDAAGRKVNRRRRSIASGDVVVLLDALILRLGEGLETAAAPRPQNDEDEVGADEEDGGAIARTPPDNALLAKACRGKVRRLIKRMAGQLECAAEQGRARRALVQLAAVLGVLRTLRIIEQRPEWRRKQLRLIEPEDTWRLFEVGAIAGTWGSGALVERALAETDGEWFEELSMVIGLLAWLAWDVGLDIEVYARRGGQQGVEENGWYGVQLFASIAPWLAFEGEAQKLLDESILRTPRRRTDGDRWFLVHVALAERIAEVTTAPGRSWTVGRVPRPGDLVLLGERFLPRVRVVLDVEPTRGDKKVVCFDAGDKKSRRAFLASRVATLAWSAFIQSGAGVASA